MSAGNIYAQADKSTAIANRRANAINPILVSSHIIEEKNSFCRVICYSDGLLSALLILLDVPMDILHRPAEHIGATLVGYRFPLGNSVSHFF